MSTTISALANEIFCEIFQHIYHSQTVHEWHKETLPSLRLVSRHWNQIIEALPMLWTSILITEKSAFQSGQPPFQSTQLRLLRSLELPLNIHINLHISTKENSFNKSDAIILGEILQEEAPRIVSMEIRTNSHARTVQTIILTRLNDTRMPLLHSFSHTDPAFRVPRRPRARPTHEDDYPSSILQFQGIPETRRIITEWGRDLYPSLTDIELVGVLYNLKRIPVMYGLRRLRIGEQPARKRLPLNELLEILSPAKDTLQVLQLEDVARSNTTLADTLPSSPIIFHKLKILSLGYCNPAIAYAFLESARLPALVDLTLTYTSIPGYTDPHVCVYRSLIRHVPLDRIERLALVNAVFSFYSSHMVDIPHPGEGMPEAARDAYAEKLKERGFVPVDGRWKVPLFMSFIYGLRSLKHLRICDSFGLKRIVGTYWRLGTLSRLETLYVDGGPEGLVELMRYVEDERKLANVMGPLKVSMGKDLEDDLSKEEKGEVYHLIEGLAML